MKKNILNLLVVALLGVGMQSCFHNVQRLELDDDKDISGKWNDVDSRLTAETMIDQVLEDDWLKDHMRIEKAKPVVIVGFVKNKSHEHIDAETFVNDVERSFIQSKKVRLVTSGDKREELRGERADQQTNSSVSTMKKWGLEVGADYIMQGSINTIVDAYKRKKVVYYQVNLELTNMESNEVVWIGEKKIKKFVRN